MEEIVSFAFFLNVFYLTSGMSGTIQYANIGENVILICQKANGAKDLRWLRDKKILTDGHDINDEIPRHTMITINVEKDTSQYNLRIANVTVDDFGVYLCEMQIGKQVERQQVTLIETAKKETWFSSEVSTSRRILTTASNTENTGFVVVLFVSIWCNICISNYRNRQIQYQAGQRKNEIQHMTIGDDSVQELRSVGDMSNASSRYETVDENNITMLNSEIHEHRKQGQTLNTELSSLSDQSYLEVVGDDNVYNGEKSAESYIDTHIDVDIVSKNLKHLEESILSSTSNSQVHVDIEYINKLVGSKVNPTKDKELKYPYLTLNSSEMNNCQSYCTAVNPDIITRNNKPPLILMSMKRNSCP